MGEYVIVRHLGEGGFGTVYEALHPVIGKRAAVKILHAPYSADEQFTSRFVAEARAVNQIRHKNIVDIFSFGDLPDGRHYYVMELLEGAPLDAYLDRAMQLPVEEALPILEGIAKALAAAHEAGLAHRDLKPENVFLELDREGFVHPKLLDFGMAKLLDSSIGVTHKTRSQAPIGSPRYMSPEQCRGVPVDARTDVYAFGCLAYRMLAGEVPFDASTALEVMMAHVSTQPVPPSHRASQLSALYDEPILRMLEKSPEARPQTLMSAYESLVEAARQAGLRLHDVPLAATDALRELVETRRLPDVPDPVRRTESRERSRNTPRRLSWAFVMVGLGVVATTLGVLAFVSPFGGAREPGGAPSSLSEGTSAPTRAMDGPRAAVTAGAATQRSAAPQPENIRLTLRSQPSGADVFLGERRLGSTPGPFELRAGADELWLDVRARGYAPARISVRPSRDQQLSVVLAPRRPKVPSTKTPGDLEDPY